MLRSFLAWLDDFIADKGTIGLASGALGILAFGGTMAVVFGNTTIRAAAVMSVLLLTLGLFTALVAARSKAIKRYKVAERLVAEYCAKIDELTGQTWRILAWDDYVEVASNGDTTERVRATLAVEGNEMKFFRIRNGSGWLQPARHQRSVKVEASTIAVDDGRAGTSWDLTSSWLPNGRLEILAHCHIPTVSGSTLSIQLFYKWPRKCQPLMRGERDHFWLSFNKGIENLTYTLVLPDGRETNHELYDPRVRDRCQLTPGRDASGRRTQLQLVAQDVKPGEKVGIWLQLKKR